jgi:hypothetical protein
MAYVIVRCFWQRAHESPTGVRSAEVCSIGYLVLETGKVFKGRSEIIFPRTRDCSSKSRIVMKQLGAQPSSLRNETTCLWIRFHRSTSTTKNLIPTERAALFVRDQSGVVPSSRAKALPPIDDALNGTAFTFFCYFDFFGILGSFENSNDCPKIWTLLFKLSYSQ